MKSTPPASLFPGDSELQRRAHARFVAALLSAGVLALAAWLTVNTGDAVPGTRSNQLWLALIALALSLTGIVFFLAASVAAAAYHQGDLAVDRSARTMRRMRSLSRTGGVLAIAAVLLIAALGTLLIVAPDAERAVSVQFSEITGRVQLEYCPSLPSSFEAVVKPADLAGSSTLLPVWVASRVCGNPSFQRGVWLYLNRSTVTVADAGDR